MAGDWIKMRTDLYRDPKVCIIAECLMDDGGELARHVSQNCQRDMTVTRNALRNAAVGALVSVWGVMRHRGKAISNALVCHGVTVSILDDIADLPGFGKAMMVAGWVKETEKGIEFPRFFEEYNVDPSLVDPTNSERQKRFRERKKAENCTANSNALRNGNSNGKSNARGEKRRVNTNPPNPLSKGKGEPVLSRRELKRQKDERIAARLREVDECRAREQAVAEAARAAGGNR